MPEEVPSRARDGPAAGEDAPGVEAEAEPARTADAREPVGRTRFVRQREP
jgi:hypothetical protein